jgi:hypothetical protein
MRHFASRDVHHWLEEIVAPRRTALLVADMQSGLCEPTGAFGRRGAVTARISAPWRITARTCTTPRC